MPLGPEFGMMVAAWPCSWSLWRGKGREGDGHDDENMVVLRHGGGRPRRVVGRLAGDPAAGPTSTTRNSPDRQRRYRRGGFPHGRTRRRRLGGCGKHPTWDPDLPERRDGIRPEPS